MEAPSGGGRNRVVVGVSKDTSCKDAIKWALSNKLKAGEGSLVLLHVVTKVPSPMGMEMYQSEVNNTMFVHYVRTVVQPMMLSLKKLIDPKIKLELKVGRNNSKEKGIVEESRKLRATHLILGTSGRGMFSMRGKGSSTGAFCVKNKPSGVSVYVISKEKVVLFREAEGSPLGSSASSPSGSGRLSYISAGGNSGTMSPAFSGPMQSGFSGPLSEGNLSRSTSSNCSEDGGNRSGSASPAAALLLNRTASHPMESEENAIMRNYSQPFTRSPQWGGMQQSGVMPYMPQHSQMFTPPSGSPSVSSVQGGSGNFPTGSVNLSPSGSGVMNAVTGHSGPIMPQGAGGAWAAGAAAAVPQGTRGPAGGYDIEHAAALSSMAWSQSPVAVASLPGTSISDYEQWKATQVATNFRQQTTDYMVELEARLAQARQALASMPVSGGPPGYDASALAAAGGALPGASSPFTAADRSPGESGTMAADRQPTLSSSESTSAASGGGAPAEGADAAGEGSIGGGSSIENDLKWELEMMRKKIAEAEQARMEAERRARMALTHADMSLREVEEQNKRREMETALRIELAAQEAARAMAAAEEARRTAELETQKTEQALKQAAVTKQMLEAEAKKRKQAEERARHEVEARRSMHSYRQYTYEEIKAATDNFRPERKLGEGGFGTVFSGTLHHTPVAVKVLKNTDAMQAATEFQQEVEVLGQIQHPHMVMLLGCCPEKYCLVYEYMANGSLEDRLLCNNGTPPLPWYTRMRIAAEVSSALLILHTRPIPIVHRDLKPANILLDKNFVAKLGDVGLAKLMPGLSMDQTYMRESVPVGTFAYVDPEFQRTGEFGPKSDVYALGIVLLDLLTGRKPNIYEGLEEAVDGGDEETLAEYLDEKAGDWPVPLAMEVAGLAVKCSEMRRKKRPDLEHDVLPVLDRVREVAVKAEDDAKRATTPRGGKPMDAPSSLFCPITQEVMVNPVLAADGHTYELEAIQQWLLKSDRSPMTNMKLPNKELMPNHAVRSMVQEWQERKKAAEAKKG